MPNPNLTKVEPLFLPPGLKTTTVPEQKIFDGKVFPLILVPDGDEARDWTTWLHDNAQFMKDLLFEFGAILFRDFDIDSGKRFDDFAKAFRYDDYYFQGNFSNRTPVVGNVVTANDNMGQVIPFHHEFVHCYETPAVIFFYCEYPCEKDGETPIVLSNIVYREMAEKEPEFTRRLHHDEISAIRVIPEADDLGSFLGTSWRSSFKCKTREECEKNATGTGHFDLEWLPDGSLRCKIRPVPGIRVDKKSGKVLFFNYVYTAYEGLNDRHNTQPTKSAIWKSNGEYMPERAMKHLKEALWNNCVMFKWQAGDVVLLDNIQVQHGRKDFNGPRRVLTTMYTENEPRLV